MKNIIQNLKISNFSKKFILVFLDICIIVFSVFVSFSLRLDSFYNPFEIDFRIYIIFIVVIIYSFYINNIYQILISFFDNQSIIKIIKVVLYSQIILFFINLALHKSIFFPRSISIISPIISCILFVLVRIILNYLINLNFKSIASNNNILIYGINKSTFSLLKNLRNYPNYGKVVAFIDDKDKYKKRELSGVKIFKTIEIDNILKNYNINEILVNNKTFSKKKFNLLFKKFEKLNIRIKYLNEIKNSKNFLNKSLEVQPNFFDIIDRPKIEVEKKILSKKIKNKNILVTGGGGSIGSALCLEILKHNPKKLYILDNSEISLYNILKKVESIKAISNKKFNFILGDCSDIDFLLHKFKLVKIDDIYHAAAYKHVGFGEENLYSIIKNNILGTKSVLELGITKKVKNFIFVSTDKAVNPKSVLGYTKKIGECLVNIYSKKKNINKKTRFTVVRFGNVIGSSGSVIPLFLDQIKKTKPLTVTHKNVKRYFMSISEAVQLIINSSYLNGKNFNIFALDMGDQVKIYDIALRIIRLSGYTIKNSNNINGDIPIKIIGLKKGEKIKEEIALGTNLKKTSNSKIMLCDEKIIPVEKLFRMLIKKVGKNGISSNLLKKIPY